jgi:PAS domain S-box-containing protein
MRKYFNPVTLAAISVCLVFIVDFIVPPDTAIGILYLVTMMLVFNETKRIIILFALITSALILVEVFIDYGLHYSIYNNRMLSFAAIWISYPILIKYRTLNKEKAKKQEAIFEQERRYHKTVDNLIEGAQIIGFDWKYIYVNDAVVRQSQYTREELIGYTMSEKYPGIENSDMYKALQECMAERKSMIFENKFDFQNDSFGYFKLSIQPIPEGLFILSMDISERKRREQNHKQYIAELEEMIFMTSHKVRQPVAHILGFINMLKGDSGKHSEENLKKIAGYMLQSSLALDSFTRELTELIHAAKERNHLEK